MPRHRLLFFAALLPLAAALLAGRALAQAAPTNATAEAKTNAVPTEITVRAVSQDAKLIQTSVGGARITIRNAETGEVLAEGIQQGGSGSTEKIMCQPHRRGASPYDTEGAARFDTKLALRAPTRVVVEAEGPLGYPQAQQRAQATLLLVPGRHIRGGGLVLTLHGFIVEHLTVDGAANRDNGDDGSAPPRYAAGAPVPVRARVRMLCGCPTTPGGLWDSDRLEVQARLRGPDGMVVQRASLGYAGTASTYEGRLALPDGAGRYEVEILATDAEKTNFGRTSRSVRLE